jgi:hypothetical protein
MLTYKDFIGQDDIKFWDGISRTFTRTTSTGGTVTLNKVGNLVDALQVYGSGDTYTDATLNDAISQIGSNKAAIVIAPGTWTISNNVTFPNTTTVIIPQGTTLNVASGKTITFNGDIITGIYQIFSGSGTATINKNPVIYPEWWGALGDGSTDDTTAITTAIAASSGKKLLFTKTTYIVDTIALDETADDFIIEGSSLGVTLKLKASATDTMFKINVGQANSALYTENVIIKNITFDGNRSNQTDNNIYIFNMFQCAHFEFNNVVFKETYGKDVLWLDTCNNIRLTGPGTLFDNLEGRAMSLTDTNNIIIDDGVYFKTAVNGGYSIDVSYSAAVTTPILGLKVDGVTLNGIGDFLQATLGGTGTNSIIALSNINGLDIDGNFVLTNAAHSIYLENIALYDSGSGANTYWLYINDSSTITDKVYVKNVTAIKANGNPILYYDPDGQVSFSPESLIRGHQESTATSGTGEDDLKSVTIPAYDGKAGASPMVGHVYHIKAAGTMTNNNDNKTVKLYWGTEVIATLSELNNGFVTAAAKGYDAGDWLIEADVYQVQFDTIRTIVRAYRNENLVLADVVSSITFDMSSAFTCKITGECDNASDVITQWIFEVIKK